jgi:uncharacterized protein (UPF0248 family)
MTKGENGTNQEEQTEAQVPQQAHKLRPVMDILNRLKWDQSFNVDNFVVVYRDRHSGMLEKPVKDWVIEKTEKDWIPQDRIWGVKRVSDKVMVWDRAARKDLINE